MISHMNEETPSNYGAYFKKPVRKQSYYIYTKFEYLENILKNDELKVIFPEDCNDPMEFTTKDIISPVGDDLHGMICFTETPCHPVMWAHYADNHRGICLEFQFDVSDTKTNLDLNQQPTQYSYDILMIDAHLTKCFLYPSGCMLLGANSNGHVPLPAVLFPVIYTEEKPEYPGYDYLPFTNPENLAQSEISISPHVFMKSKEWEYEKEHRLYVRIVKGTIFHDGIYFVTNLTKYIRRIILGLKCQQSYDEVMRLLMNAIEVSEEPFLIQPTIARAGILPFVKNTKYI